LRKAAGGGLSTVLRVARVVLVIFFPSSTVAAAVWSSKNSWYARAGKGITSLAIGINGPLAGIYYANL